MDKYFERSLLIIEDIFGKYKGRLTKENCKLIGNWLIKISSEEMTQELLLQLDRDLFDNNLDWAMGDFN